jgi:hypothetical protein
MVSIPKKCPCPSCRWNRGIFKDFKRDDRGRILRRIIVLKVDCTKHNEPISIPLEECENYELKFRKGDLTTLSGSQVEVKTYEVRGGNIVW